MAALPAKDLALGLPDNGTAAPEASERITYDLVTEAFGPGYNAPLLVTVDIIRTTDPLGVMDALGKDLGRLDGVEAIGVTTPNRKADLGIVQVIPERAQTDPQIITRHGKPSVVMVSAEEWARKTVRKTAAKKAGRRR